MIENVLIFSGVLLLIVTLLLWRAVFKLKRANKALLEAQERFEMAMDASNDGIFENNLQTGQTYHSNRMYTMLGVEPVRDDPFAWWSSRVEGNIHEVARRCLAGEIDHFDEIITVKPKPEQIFYIRSRGKVYKDANGKPIRIMGTHSDVTELVSLQRHFSVLSQQDTLTGLLNRRGIRDQMEMMRSRLQRSSRCAALLFIDLDDFKPVNDRFGHECGDEVLKESAQRLLHVTRKIDIVARLGGDEFAVVLSDLQCPSAYSDARHIAQKVLEALDAPHRPKNILHNEPIHVSSSIGVVIFNEHSDLDEIFNRGDAAMYEAKRGGKNTLVMVELNALNG